MCEHPSSDEAAAGTAGSAGPGQGNPFVLTADERRDLDRLRERWGQRCDIRIITESDGSRVWRAERKAPGQHAVEAGSAGDLEHMLGRMAW
jgi:hypothetical protein